MFTLFRRLRARVKYRHFERDLAREIEVHRARLEISGEQVAVWNGDVHGNWIDEIKN